MYHGKDIGDWHEGRISSRKVLALLDGLPAECWYKLSVLKAVEEFEEEAELAHGNEVRSLVFAQLTGQTIDAGTT